MNFLDTLSDLPLKGVNTILHINVNMKNYKNVITIIEYIMSRNNIESDIRPIHDLEDSIIETIDQLYKCIMDETKHQTLFANIIKLISVMDTETIESSKFKFLQGFINRICRMKLQHYQAYLE